MADQRDPSASHGRYSSPPCLAAEIDPTYFDPLGVDPEQARDVVRWRRAERERLRAYRRGLGGPVRRQWAEALRTHLYPFLTELLGQTRNAVLGGYWPIHAEADLRALWSELYEAGFTVALPLVERRNAPLVFRRWNPAMRLVSGIWDIPVPPPDAELLVPSVLIAPVLGWDQHGFRLGYGGGYFDRTLAVLDPRPYAIGVGLQAARIATIYPQPHDIGLDAIVTEDGFRVQRRALSSNGP